MADFQMGERVKPQAGDQRSAIERQETGYMAVYNFRRSRPQIKPTTEALTVGATQQPVPETLAE